MAYISGSYASDIIDDNYSGFDDSDIIDALDGNDTIVMADDVGGDYVYGGYGSDLVSYEQFYGGVSVNLENGTAWNGYSTDYLYDIEDVTGSYYDDTIWGNFASNNIYGLGGDDVVIMADDVADDFVDGGTGNDLISYAQFSTGVYIDLEYGFAEDALGYVDTFTSIEDAEGTAYNDTIWGNFASNYIYGLGGDDVVIMADDVAYDFVDGGTGNDLISYAQLSTGVYIDLEYGFAQDALSNDDTFTSIEDAEGTAYNDTIWGNFASNYIYGLGGDDWIDGSSGADYIDGGDGYDTASYYQSTAGVNVSLASGLGSAGGAAGDRLYNIEDLEGSNFGDSLTGSAVTNFMYGQGGNDTIYGVGGNDFLYGDPYGDAGNDTLIGGAGADTLIGGLGNDTYDLENGVDTVTDTGGTADRIISTITRSLASYTAIEQLTLGGVANINGTGNNASNIITGNAGANTLAGGLGNDTLSGVNGNDTLNGSTGNDTLSGGNGNDKLIGGIGIDTLTGGANNDIFVFNAPRSAANRDVITDFNHVADTFHIENAVFTHLGAGVHALASGMLRLGTKALDGNDFLIYNKANGVLSYDHDANGAGAAITIATLTNKPVLAANDFLVI